MPGVWNLVPGAWGLDLECLWSPSPSATWDASPSPCDTGMRPLQLVDSCHCGCGEVVYIENAQDPQKHKPEPGGSVDSGRGRCMITCRKCHQLFHFCWIAECPRRAGFERPSNRGCWRCKSCRCRALFLESPLNFSKARLHSMFVERNAAYAGAIVAVALNSGIRVRNLMDVVSQHR